MGRFPLLLFPLLGACAAAPSRAEPFSAPAPVLGLLADIPAGGFEALAQGQSPAEPGLEPVQEPARADRQVIFNGWLALQVVDPERAENEAGALARELGGWIQRLERPRIVLRFPAARFDTALARLSALGLVLDKKIQASDVTDQFRDLKLRLENAEKVRARLAALLDKAGIIPDALAVEKELARVTEEIERLKGAIAAMQDQVAFSTISVDLRRSVPFRAREEWLPFGWVRGLGPEPLFHFERRNP